MNIRIYREVHEFIQKIVNNNFSTNKRYKNTLSEAEKAEKICLLVYNQCKENHDGFHSAEIHREVFYKITKNHAKTKSIINKLVSCGLIKIQSEHGTFKGDVQSRKFRLGQEVYRLMNDCKTGIHFINDFMLNEVESSFNYIVDNNYCGNTSNINVSRGNETAKKCGKTINPSIPRDTFNCQSDKNIILESSDLSAEITATPSECIAREDLNIYKNFELDHNLLWQSKLSFTEKVKLEKQILKHEPAHPCKSGKSFRINHWIHSLNSDYRQYITLFDSHIEEVWDKSCCYPSMVAVLCQGKVSKSELNEYTNLVQLGDIYTSALKHSGIETSVDNRNEIKRYFQTFIQGGKKDAERLYNTTKPYWNPKKQIWVKPEYIHAVMDFYQDKFPEIYNTILNWEVRDSDGKKTISTECSRLEKELIQEGICRMIPCKWFTIHDAIFIRTEDKKLIEEFNFDAKFWQLAGFNTINLI